MRYQCCDCQEIFDAKSAVDGFKQGYRVGFLCPICKKNIKDDPMQSRQVINTTSERIYFAVVTAYGMLSLLALQFLPPDGWIQYAWVGGGLLVLTLYGLIRYPKLFTAPIATTVPGPGKHTSDKK